MRISTVGSACLFIAAGLTAAAEDFPLRNPAGIAVTLGMPDAATLTSLVGKGRTAVQCVVASEADAAEGRKLLLASPLLGFVTVVPWDGGLLPYPDRTADAVLVADSRVTVPMTEVQRILEPLGVMYQFNSGRWTATPKAWDAGLGEVRSPRNRNATKFFYDEPSLFGSFELAWLSGPTWGEGIATGPFGTVSSQGIHIVGTSTAMLAKGLKGARSSHQTAKEKFLCARNAFNGVLLWERALNGPGAMACSDALLFIRQGNQVLALDLRSGEQRFAVDLAAIEDIVCNGPVLAVIGKGLLTAFAADTGKKLWQQQGMSALGPNDARSLYAEDKIRILKLRGADGAIAWERLKNDIAGKNGIGFATLGSGIIGLQGKETFHALDTETGATRWSKPFVITGDNPLLKRLAVRHKEGVVYLDREGYKASDGSAAGTLGTIPDNACSATLMTINIAVDSRMNIFDFTGKTSATAGAARLPCGGGGSLIANGLFYGLSSDCACNSGQLQALSAFGNSRGTFAPALFQKPLVLTKGPGFGKVGGAAYGPDEWTEYGGNAAHDFAVAGVAPRSLNVLWKTPLFTTPRQGPITESWRASGQIGLTPPVVAGGVVVVTNIDSNQVHGLDARTGAVSWSFTAGASVTVPPTLAAGRCLFGANDGAVYCLDVSSGVLQWQVRMAPDNRRMLSFGRWTSPWPVQSGVSIVNGIAQAVAGYTAFVHGGLIASAINVDTGAVQWTKQITQSWRGDNTGGRNLLLQNDGKLVYRGGNSLIKDGNGTWPKRSFISFPSSIGGLNDISELKEYESPRNAFVPTSFPSPFSYYKARAMAQDSGGMLLVGWVNEDKDKSFDRHSIAMFHHPDSKVKLAKGELPTPQWEIPQPSGRGFQGALLTSNAAIALLSHIDNGKLETASEVIVMDRTTGKMVTSIVLPEIAAHGGMAFSGGRIVVTTRSGTVYSLGGWIHKLSATDVATFKTKRKSCYLGGKDDLFTPQ